MTKTEADSSWPERKCNTDGPLNPAVLDLSKAIKEAAATYDNGAESSSITCITKKSRLKHSIQTAEDGSAFSLIKPKKLPSSLHCSFSALRPISLIISIDFLQQTHKTFY